jgi:hypothetical protein
METGINRIIGIALTPALSLKGEGALLPGLCNKHLNVI